MVVKICADISSYKKINMIFILMIIFIFLYCLIVPFLNFGFNSTCEEVPLVYCKSRGLTRAFSQILRFNFSSAISYNPYSIKIFLFFLIQLIARLFINRVMGMINLNRVQSFDIFFSLLFFIFSFYNLVFV